MRGVNKVILVGTLGKDPDIKEISSGKMATFSMATSEAYKDRNGNLQESTEWHRITVFGAMASVIEQYAKKGSRIYVEGKIKTTKTQDGKFFTSIQGNQVLLLDNKDSAMRKAVHPHAQTPFELAEQERQRQSNYKPENGKYGEEALTQIFDDDVPF